MRLEPLANRVIMEEIPEGKRTRGGLFVPDIARKNKGITYAKVLAVGPGRNTPEGGTVKCHVKAGDVVMIPRAAPAVIPLVTPDGFEHDVLMCPENDIIAVVHDMPIVSTIVDADGAPLSIAPQSLALPDAVYANREGVDRAVSDLRESKAPPDVIEEIQREQVDSREGDDEVIEH